MKNVYSAGWGYGVWCVPVKSAWSCSLFTLLHLRSPKEHTIHVDERNLTVLGLVCFLKRRGHDFSKPYLSRLNASKHCDSWELLNAVSKETTEAKKHLDLYDY